METFEIRYIFDLPDEQQEIIDFFLNSQTLDLLNDIPEELPAWTRLDFHQCPNCTLSAQGNSYCPIACHLVNLSGIFRRLLSYDKIHVQIITPQRLTSKETDAQKGISSLMGLIMATSGCPHTAFFKPMARHHLPFANADETVYRAASMYLLAQYFLYKKGKKADWDLEGLRDIYSNIQMLNRSIIERLRQIVDKDSAINALLILNVFAQTLSLVLDGSLEDVRYLFEPYLKESQYIITDKKHVSYQ